MCSRLSKDDIWRWLIACRIFFNIQSLALKLFLVTSYCTYSSTCTIVLCFNWCLFFDRIISRMFSTLWSEQRYWLCTVQLLFLSVFVFWDVNIIIVFSYKRLILIFSVWPYGWPYCPGFIVHSDSKVHTQKGVHLRMYTFSVTSLQNEEKANNFCPYSKCTHFTTTGLNSPLTHEWFLYLREQCIWSFPKEYWKCQHFIAIGLFKREASVVTYECKVHRICYASTIHLYWYISYITTAFI